MASIKKVFFVQGHGVSSPTEKGDWPDWLGCELKNEGLEFVVLPMPDPMYPDITTWLNFLNEQKIEVDENTFFVGHSLGCITIARFLEKLPENQVAGGCVFVSGFLSLPDIPLLADFCNLPLDFSLVKKHSREFAVVISDNDHVIAPVLSREFASKLNAQVLMEHKRGHFITGTKKIQSVLITILAMAQIKPKTKKWWLFGF